MVSEHSIRGDYSWISGIAIHSSDRIAGRKHPQRGLIWAFSVMANYSIQQYVHEIVPSPS
jgi:hypothetical protein